MRSFFARRIKKYIDVAGESGVTMKDHRLGADDEIADAV